MNEWMNEYNIEFRYELGYKPNNAQLMGPGRHMYPNQRLA